MGLFFLSIFFSLLGFLWMTQAFQYQERNQLGPSSYQSGNQPGYSNFPRGNQPGYSNFPRRNHPEYSNFPNGNQMGQTNLPAPVLVRMFPYGFYHNLPYFPNMQHFILLPPPSSFGNYDYQAKETSNIPKIDTRRASDTTEEPDPSVFFENDSRRSLGEGNNSARMTVYHRGKDAKILTQYDSWWDYSLSTNVIVLIPGFVSNNAVEQQRYVSDFCSAIKDSFLTMGSFTIICFDWKPVEQDFDALMRGAQASGSDLAGYLERRFSNISTVIHLIAHDVGCVVAQITGIKSFRPLDFIFGLDQRELPVAYNNFYLRKNAGIMLELLYKGYKPTYEVQRNFYYAPRSPGVDVPVYQIFAESVAQNGEIYKGFVCPSYFDYKHGNCDQNKKYPIWRNTFLEKIIDPLDRGDFFIPGP